MRTSLGTIPLPDTISRHNTSVISLGQVRPGPRVTNEYVDSPRVHALQPLKTHIVSIGGGGGSSPGFAHRVILPSPPGERNGRSQRPVLSSLPTTAVTQQPLPKCPSLKQDPVISLDGIREGEAAHMGNPSGGAGHGDSIICDKCGKCRCSSCTEPRTLPSRWCCHNTCEVSLNKALDVCTCFCCIKCIFYHCGAEEDNECYEKPCGCTSTPHCCQRWTVMGMMSLCLPCLWTYWPAKAGLATCTMCYNHFRRNGCQCHLQPEARTSVASAGESELKVCTSDTCRANKGGNNSRHSQTRRLLIESDSSSA
ncbi:unnamed protein product [Candidula unifasciata]|uniref:Protein sprouty homolog 2 n=1 Tax=Candidula unifasciata TaxID=100452 RepID=A0A8S3ZI48_9EUPU|nr:unnamed protein product [Candidula unifasciata]